VHDCLTIYGAKGAEANVGPASAMEPKHASVEGISVRRIEMGGAGRGIAAGADPWHPDSPLLWREVMPRISPRRTASQSGRRAGLVPPPPR
jgi:hypothetical protein